MAKTKVKQLIFAKIVARNTKIKVSVPPVKSGIQSLKRWSKEELALVKKVLIQKALKVYDISLTYESRIKQGTQS